MRLPPSTANVMEAGATISGELQTWGKTNKVYESLSHGFRYAEWTAALKRGDLFPMERLLPTILVPDCGALPPAMQTARERPPDEDLLTEIRRHQWGYYFDLGGGQSTLGDASRETPAHRISRQRMLYRMNAINGAIAALYGGDLSGRRVLDLACNHGAFSLDLLTRGATFARGVDIRVDNIGKAKLLARRLGIENAEFVQGDIYDEPESRNEIVLCLGLLYHVTKPYELVELCYRLCTEMAVIDTVTHREPFSGFVLGLGQMIPQEHAAGAINVELHPTYRGLIDLMRVVGFREIVEVEGIPDPGWVDWDKDIYALKFRRCLIGLR